MSSELIIRGASVMTPSGAADCDVAIAEGKIAALLPRGEGEARQVVVASGLTLLPGAIDIHCHVRAPAFPQRGTVESETRAAAAGGITTLFEMPITTPCCNSAERVLARRDHFAGRAHVNFGLYAAPRDTTRSYLQAIRDAGTIAFKVFTTAMPEGRSDEFDGLCHPGEADQLTTLTAIAATGLPVVVHAESADLLAHYERASAGLDRALASTHTAARPALCEAAAVARLLTLNIEAQAKLHIAHVTSAATVDILRRFAGTSDFSAETCPHYLLRTSQDVARVGVAGKINPPVREAADQDALWSAIADGTIRHVTTDHAAFTRAEKEAAMHDFIAAPAGTPGLEVLLPCVLDAVASGRMDLSKAVDLVSGNAASRFDLPAKGRIAVGADADLVLVDLAGTTRIDAARLFTQGREVAQLYDGLELRGKIVSTIVGGAMVFDRGAIQGEPRGRYVTPVSSAAREAAA